jgi:GxxExxY protein
VEAVYQEALAIELESRQIPFEREVPFPVYYKRRQLSMHYRADFICYGTIVVELKAPPRLTGIEASQSINHLKGPGLKTGLLVNFGGSSLAYKRFVN